MKKTIYSIVAMAILAGLLAFLAPLKTQAGGGGPETEFTKSAGSATADNASSITFILFKFYYRCDNGNALYLGACEDGSTPHKEGVKNLEYSVAVSGTGNTLGGTYTGPNGAPTVKTGDDGKASFTLKSSVAESKTVTMYFTELNDPNHSQNSKLEVSFTAPAAPKKTTPTPTPAPVAEVKPPDAPIASTIEANGTTVASSDTIKVGADEDLTLKGTTVANGIVKLYIFSTPSEATATADAQGNWSYAISGLEAGAHHVEAEVTDPATSKTSARATLASFTVEEPAATMAAQQPKPKDTNLIWILIAAAIGILLAGAFVCWWLWKRKKQAKLKDQTPDHPETTSPEQTDDQQNQSGS